MKLKDWADRLIWATVLISVVRYAAAFAASDLGEIIGVWSNVLTFMLSITGIGMGVLDTIGGGLLFNGWSRVFPKAGQKWSMRFIILTTCVFGLLVSGLFILVPFTMSRLSHESVLIVLGGKNSVWSWVWSTMVNIIPYILIAGVFTGNKMVVSLEGEESTQKVSGNSSDVSESKQKVSDNFPKTWRQLRPQLSDTDLINMARWDSAQVKKVSEQYGVDIRTVTNWRTYAKEELGENINVQ